MERWERVTLAWDLYSSGICTSVDEDGCLDFTLHNPMVFDSEAEKKVHHLRKMEIISQPRSDSRRSGIITLDIEGCFIEGSHRPPCSKEIVELLKASIEKLRTGFNPTLRWAPSITSPERESWMETEFIISFALENGEQFCDTAIELGRAIFNGLGIKDDSGHYLARFSLKRETFVKIDDSWISFVRWLRINHRLPIQGPEDRV